MERNISLFNQPFQQQLGFIPEMDEEKNYADYNNNPGNNTDCAKVNVENRPCYNNRQAG